MNGWMGIFRTISSLGATGGRGKGEHVGMLRGRRTAGGRRSWDGVKPLGMQRLFTRGRADCGLCQVTSCLHALGYASYIIRREREKRDFVWSVLSDTHS